MLAPAPLLSPARGQSRRSSVASLGLEPIMNKLAMPSSEGQPLSNLQMYNEMVRFLDVDTDNSKHAAREQPQPQDQDLDMNGFELGNVFPAPEDAELFAELPMMDVEVDVDGDVEAIAPAAINNNHKIHNNNNDGDHHHFHHHYLDTAQAPHGHEAQAQAPAPSTEKKRDRRMREVVTEYEGSVVSDIVSNRAKEAMVIRCEFAPKKELRVKSAVYITKKFSKRWDGRQWRRLCIVAACHSAARGSTDFCISHGKGEVQTAIIGGEKVNLVTSPTSASMASAPAVSMAQAAPLHARRSSAPFPFAAAAAHTRMAGPNMLGAKRKSFDCGLLDSHVVRKTVRTTVSAGHGASASCGDLSGFMGHGSMASTPGFTMAKPEFMPLPCQSCGVAMPQNQGSCCNKCWLASAASALL